MFFSFMVFGTGGIKHTPQLFCFGHEPLTAMPDADLTVPIFCSIVKGVVIMNRFLAVFDIEF